jgi:hypothetical protein
VNVCRGELTGTADDAFVVEAAIHKQKVDLEWIVTQTEITTSQMSPESRRLPLTPGAGSGEMTSSVTSFTSDAEGYAFGVVKTSGYFSSVNSSIQSGKIRSFVKYRTLNLFSPMSLR